MMRNYLLLSNYSLQRNRPCFQLYLTAVRLQSVTKSQNEQPQSTVSKTGKFSRLFPFGKSKASTPTSSSVALPQFPNTNSQQTGPTLDGRVASLQNIGGPIRTCKPYSPPADVPTQVFRIAQKVAKELKLEKSVVTPSLQFGGSLEGERLFRFTLIAQCIAVFGHDVPNSELPALNSLAAVTEYFARPVSDRTRLERLASDPKRPPNLHVRLDYIHFNPEDEFYAPHGGRTARAGHDIVPTSLADRRRFPVIRAPRRRPLYLDPRDRL